MAIAKMKKLTILAEQEYKDEILKSVQEMQSLEVMSLGEEMGKTMLVGLNSEQTPADTTALADISETLQDIRYTLNYLDDFVPGPGTLEKLRTKKEVFTLKELEERVEQYDIEGVISQVSQKEKQLNQLDEEMKDLKQEEDYLRRWRSLNFLPEEVAHLRLMDVLIGSVDKEHAAPMIDEFKENGRIYFEEIYIRGDEHAYLIILPKEEHKKLTQITNQYSFQEVNYEYKVLPEDALYQNLLTQKEKRELVSSIKLEMKQWKEQYRQLELAEEYYYNLSERKTATDLLVNSEHLFLLTGWIEEAKADDLKAFVLDTSGDSNVAILTDDIDVDEYQDVPVVLENNTIVKPFEMITEMFSFPRYGGVDPTGHMVPFFIIFFGIMSADLGYGLLLFGVTLAALKLLHLKSGAARFMKFLHINSYSTMFFGLFFGSIFGAELPFNVLSLQDDVLTVMILSVALGLIQMIYSLILNGVIKTSENDKSSAYVDGFAWAMILVGIVIWVLGSMVFNNDLVAQAGIILAVINVIGILIISMLANSNKALGLGLGLYNLYGISGYVGDAVSYTRLMALAVASANIGMAFNMIVGLLPPIFRFTVGLLLMVALHAINIGLTMLSAYVHTSRLQYVEFFGKFYEGGGKPLTPLKTLEKHISIKE
ncbi:V-type ATP synthase subunit I [Alkalibacterium sp. MB6]|uniref:V-type ATP synthase subunit I n=1 Tax=Alkalibacterium sp. MB6 TaxID=2081965 RepID=UPI00137B795F|nr:V-type ATP synthase subunit I [Alkalibacterium sp. MB6]